MKNFFPLLLLCLSFNVQSQLIFTEIFHEYDNIDFISNITHGDFNGDGVDDFVITSNSTRKTWVGINNNLTSPTFSLIDDEYDVRFFTTQDFDQDGDVDIIGSIVFENMTICWKNDGNGNFTAEILSIEDYDSIHFADLDGDGIEEMILGIDDKVNVYSIIDGNVNFISTLINDFFAGTPNALTSLDFNNGSLNSVSPSSLVSVSINTRMLLRPGFSSSSIKVN